MMVNESADFFDELAYADEDNEVPAGVPRDQYKRPMIMPPGGTELVPYTRASTMANYIASFGGLTTWKLRNLCRGMGMREDLAAEASALGHLTGDSKRDRLVNAELDDIIVRAAETAGEHVKANFGTAVHGFTDPFAVTGPVPERMQADVDSYTQAYERVGAVVFATEIFVVDHARKVAGTLDELVGIPAMMAAVVGDKKTGKKNLHSTLIQVASYSNGQAYDWEQQRSMPLEEYLAIVAQQRGVQPPAFRQDRGVYTHIPREEGVTTMHPLNLTLGREMLDLCVRVRDYRSDKSFIRSDTVEAFEAGKDVGYVRLVQDATTVTELRGIAKAADWCWSKGIADAAQVRFHQLGGPARAQQEGLT